MKHTKKLVVMVMSLALVLQPIQGKAATVADSDVVIDAVTGENGISPMTVNNAMGTIMLDIDSKTGATVCAATVTGKSGTTKISGTLTLRKGSATSTKIVKSWDVSINSFYLSVSKTCYVLEPGTYTLVLKVKIVRSGKSETLTKYISDKY